MKKALIALLCATVLAGCGVLPKADEPRQQAADPLGPVQYGQVKVGGTTDHARPAGPAKNVGTR